MGDYKKNILSDTPGGKPVEWFYDTGASDVHHNIHDPFAWLSNLLSRHDGKHLLALFYQGEEQPIWCRDDINITYKEAVENEIKILNASFSNLISEPIQNVFNDIVDEMEKSFPNVWYKSSTLALIRKVHCSYLEKMSSSNPYANL